MIIPIGFFLFFKVRPPLCYKRNIKRMLSFTHHGEVAYLSSTAMQVHSCSMDQLVLPSHYPIDYVCIALNSIVRIRALQKNCLPTSGTDNDR